MVVKGTKDIFVMIYNRFEIGFRTAAKKTRIVIVKLLSTLIVVLGSKVEKNIWWNAFALK